MNKITVIVPIYNTKEEFLRKCIESIINQSLKDIEIILVNDGSDERTKKICEEYKNNDSRIKLINQKNMGESVARNTGIENSITNYITFVDSDDWIDFDMCEKINNYMESINYDFDIISFDCYVNYENREKKNKFYIKEGLLNEKDIEEIQLQNIEKGITKYYPPETNISVPWAKIYRKDFIEKNNIKFVPNIIRMPDAIFNMEAFEKAKKIYIFPSYLYHYRKNEFSICQRYSKDTILYYETYIDFVKKYIKDYNKNEKFKDTLNIKIVTSIDNYMYNYFFNKDNPKGKKEIKKELKELLKKDLYVNAMKYVKKEYLSIYQKILLKCAKNNNYGGLKILRKIKNIIKAYF